MKYFYIVAEIMEEMPNYNFIIKAENIEEAEKLAIITLKTDYPDSYCVDKNDYSIDEITAEQLLNRLLLN